MIVQTQTTSFKEELYKGVHDLTTDTIKIALYTADASSSVAEVNGSEFARSPLRLIPDMRNPS